MVAYQRMCWRQSASELRPRLSDRRPRGVPIGGDPLAGLSLLSHTRADAGPTSVPVAVPAVAEPAVAARSVAASKQRAASFVMVVLIESAARTLPSLGPPIVGSSSSAAIEPSSSTSGTLTSGDGAFPAAAAAEAGSGLSSVAASDTGRARTVVSGAATISVLARSDGLPESGSVESML